MVIARKDNHLKEDFWSRKLAGLRSGQSESLDQRRYLLEEELRILSRSKSPKKDYFAGIPLKELAKGWDSLDRTKPVFAGPKPIYHTFGIKLILILIFIIFLGSLAFQLFQADLTGLFGGSQITGAVIGEELLIVGSDNNPAEPDLEDKIIVAESSELSEDKNYEVSAPGDPVISFKDKTFNNISYNYSIIKSKGKINLNVTLADGTNIYIRNMVSTKINASFDSTSLPSARSKIIHIESIQFDNATITLPVTGDVDTVLYCSLLSSKDFSCPEWKITSIPLKVNPNSDFGLIGATASFTVFNFSSYILADTVLGPMVVSTDYGSLEFAENITSISNSEETLRSKIIFTNNSVSVDVDNYPELNVPAWANFTKTGLKYPRLYHNGILYQSSELLDLGDGNYRAYLPEWSNWSLTDTTWGGTHVYTTERNGKLEKDDEAVLIITGTKDVNGNLYNEDSIYFNNATVNYTYWNSTGGNYNDGSYVFNSSPNGIAFPAGSQYNIRKNITIATWYKKNGFSKSYPMLIAKGTTDNNIYYVINFDQFASHLRFFIGNLTNYDYTIVAAKPIGEWFHLAGVANDTHVAIFINGILANISTRTVSDTLAASGVVCLGAAATTSSCGASNPAGEIDDFYIFDRAWSAEEIAELASDSESSILRYRPSGNYTEVYNASDYYPGVRNNVWYNVTLNGATGSCNNLSAVLYRSGNCGSLSGNLLPAGRVEVANCSWNFTQTGTAGDCLELALLSDSTAESTFSFSSLYFNSNATVVSISSLFLNSIGQTRIGTEQNLTAYATILNNDYAKIIYNWHINDKPLAVLNVPFENDLGHNITDYSSYNLSGTRPEELEYDSFGGFDGNGTFTFGDNLYVGFSAAGQLNITENITIETWSYINPFEFQGSVPTIVSKMESLENDTVTNNISYRLFYISSTSKLVFVIGNSTGATCNVSTAAPAPESYHHIVATANATNLSLFVDGQLSAVAPRTVGSMVQSSSPLCIGASSNLWFCNQDYLEGSIDEVRIYNRSLSPEQIYLLFTNRSNIIAAQETYSSENWTVKATPLSIYSTVPRGETVTSNSLLIDSAPSISSLILNSTDSSNSTNGNLTANVITSFVTNSPKLIYNWFLNSTPLAVLNVPFENINLTNTTNAWDYSGNKNNGTISGATWNATGGFDGKGAYVFDGSSSYIDFGKNTSLDLKDGFSIVAWIKTDGAAGYQTIANRGYSGNGDYYLGLYTGNTRIQVWLDGENYYNSSAASLSTGWNHIALTAATGTSNVKLYVNGRIYSQWTTTKDLVGSSVYNLRAGKDDRDENYYFDGTIDELMIFNRSLSPTQVWNLFANRSDEMASEELNNNNIWSVYATPNDGILEGNTMSSNLILINSQNFPFKINFTSPTPDNGTSQAAANVIINISVFSEGLESLVYNWDGINYTIYNDYLVLMYNFNNVSSLGESSTQVVDVSNNAINGVVNGAVWNYSGKYEGGYTFDGITKSINLSTNPLYNVGATKMTIAFWMYTSNNTFDNTVKIIMDDCTGDPNTNAGFWVGVDDRGSSDPLNGIQWAFKTTTGSWRDVECSNCIGDWGWYHVVATYNGAKGAIYVNGINRTTVNGGTSAGTGDFIPRNYPLVIGAGSGFSGYLFNGTLDEIRFWNYSLNSAEIYQQYVSNLNKFNSTQWYLYVNQSLNATDGLSEGEYTYQAFAADDYGSMNATEERTITISSGNSLPSAPILLSLANDTITTSRTPTFIWNNSEDNDDDILSYNLVIDDNPAFNNPEVNVSSITNTTLINTSYTITTTLDVDTVYYWKVGANDSEGYGTYSSVNNFTVQSYLAINIYNSTVQFGSVAPGTHKNTSPESGITPFAAENNGNIIMNITINATPYFTTVGFPTNNYRFRIMEDEVSSFNLTLSNITLINMPSASTSPHVVNLNWQDAYDNFIADIAIDVPASEPPGLKTSTLTFTITG